MEYWDTRGLKENDLRKKQKSENLVSDSLEEVVHFIYFSKIVFIVLYSFCHLPIVLKYI